MNKNIIKIRIANIIALMLHITRFALGCVAIICFFGEAVGSLWPTQFVAFGCSIVAVGAIYLIGKIISWLDRVSDKLINE